MGSESGGEDEEGLTDMQGGAERGCESGGVHVRDFESLDLQAVIGVGYLKEEVKGLGVSLRCCLTGDVLEGPRDVIGCVDGLEGLRDVGASGDVVGRD